MSPRAELGEKNWLGGLGPLIKLPSFMSNCKIVSLKIRLEKDTNYWENVYKNPTVI